MADKIENFYNRAVTVWVEIQLGMWKLLLDGENKANAFKCIEAALKTNTIKLYCYLLFCLRLCMTILKIQTKKPLKKGAFYLYQTEIKFRQ